MGQDGRDDSPSLPGGGGHRGSLWPLRVRDRDGANIIMEYECKHSLDATRTVDNIRIVYMFIHEDIPFWRLVSSLHW